MKLPFVIAICAGLILSGAAQSGEIRYDQRFSGVGRATAVDTNNDGLFIDTFSFQAKGSPGKATIESMGEFKPVMPGAGCDLQSELVQQSFVSTFNDGSMLFHVTTAGQNCVTFVPFSITGHLEGIITGGTGRFEGATGTWIVEFEAWPVGETMSATIGTTKGTIIVPD
jgi:hypothetical protein